MLYSLADETHSWLAPYAYAIVGLGLLLFLFRLVERIYASYYDRPMVRQYFSYKKLTKAQKSVLENEFDFYRRRSRRHKQQFEHRVAHFVRSKRFVGMEQFKVTDRVRLLIAAVGCMLSFGRKNYDYGLIETIIVFPGRFFSKANNKWHKGEFNPQLHLLALSWEDFELGYEITNDNLNLGIHEFMHAMHMEAMAFRDVDSVRFLAQYQNILKRLTEKGIKDRIAVVSYFRDYAFTNQFEFMAVMAEYFIESPADFAKHFPELYDSLKKLLNFRFRGY